MQLRPIAIIFLLLGCVHLGFAETRQIGQMPATSFAARLNEKYKLIRIAVTPSPGNGHAATHPQLVQQPRILAAKMPQSPNILSFRLGRESTRFPLGAACCAQSRVGQRRNWQSVRAPRRSFLIGANL